MSAVKPEVFLAISRATIRYLDKTLFPHLSFTIYKGEQWAVTGKSGSGKTALLQAVLGKYNIINGRIRYFFCKDKGMNCRHLMAFVSQQPDFRTKQNTREFYYQQRFNAFDSENVVTVHEYLEENYRSARTRLSGMEIRFSMEWVVENLNLKHLLNKSLIKLSNGETRRLLIAEALLHQPLLLLMDNPFTGLDVTTRPFLDHLLQQISKKGTHLLITASSGEIPECITHVLELSEGKITGQWKRENYLQQQKRVKKNSAWQPDPEKLKKIFAPDDERFSFTTAVKMQHIHVQYGETTILDNINWEIKKGEKWALLGPNGAGKSTLLSLISGDNPQAYANDIFLFDKKRGSGESIWDIKRKIGFMSPEMHQYFNSSSNCLEVLLSGFTDTMSVIPKKITEQQNTLALIWMDLLEIKELKDRKFREVSAGSQRLILLVRALVKNPPLLILDEPCQGLDQDQKDHFRGVVEILCQKSSRTMIYVTHHKEEIPDCVQQTLFL